MHVQGTATNLYISRHMLAWLKSEKWVCWCVIQRLVLILCKLATTEVEDSGKIQRLHYCLVMEMVVTFEVVVAQGLRRHSDRNCVRLKISALNLTTQLHKWDKDKSHWKMVSVKCCTCTSYTCHTVHFAPECNKIPQVISLPIAVSL